VDGAFNGVVHDKLPCLFFVLLQLLQFLLWHSYESGKITCCYFLVKYKICLQNIAASLGAKIVTLGIDSMVSAIPEVRKIWEKENSFSFSANCIAPIAKYQ
jgi:hypothetical protein